MKKKQRRLNSLTWDGTAAKCPYCRLSSIFLNYTTDNWISGSVGGDVVICDHCESEYVLKRGGRMMNTIQCRECEFFDNDEEYCTYYAEDISLIDGCENEEVE